MRTHDADAAALQASGLPELWSGRYGFLRSDPERAAAAYAHVTGTVRSLPTPYRWAWDCALRALPGTFLLCTGHRLKDAPARLRSRGLARLAALPGLRQLVTASTTLALYGAFDGIPERQVDEPRQFPHTVRRAGDRVGSRR